MLKKLVKNKIVLFVFLSVLWLELWVLTLIFGNGEDKVIVLVLSAVLPLITYGFARLIFKIVRINASLKHMRVFAYFFLFMGAISMVTMIVEFVLGFPNGLSPTLSACIGLIMATLDDAKKDFETGHK